MTRQVDIRIRVERDGAPYGQLLPTGTPSISAALSNPIKSSFTGEFLADPSFDFLRDEIRPLLVIDGVEHSLGVFIPTTVTPQQTDTARTVSIQAYDRCWLVKNTITESVVSFPRYSTYLSVIKKLLQEAGITLYKETPSGAFLAETREDWDIGTDYLSIVNQLLGEINYGELWFDADGYAVLQPAESPSPERIAQTLDSEDPSTLVLPQISRETDVFSAPNVFVCICDNPDKSGPMIAKAEIENPGSPMAPTRRGRRIVKLYRLDNIASQTELQAYADRLRDEAMMTTETIRVETGLRSGHQLGDTVALRFGDDLALCRQVGWAMSLKTGGVMSHTLERVIYKIG